LEYPSSFIQGKILALTTTNGTKLLHMVKDADSIIIGSFLNLDAICDYLITQGKKVLLACAAWKDRVNLEDSLFAGAVAEKIKPHFNLECDSTRIVRELYLQSQQYPSILEFVKDSNHYRRLAGFGLLKDLEYCTTPNLHPVVPIYNGRELVVA
jgi:2-phosphosulfolactate phosphatase